MLQDFLDVAPKMFVFINFVILVRIEFRINWDTRREKMRREREKENTDTGYKLTLTTM